MHNNIVLDLYRSVKNCGRGETQYTKDEKRSSSSSKNGSYVPGSMCSYVFRNFCVNGIFFRSAGISMNFPS